MRIRSNTVKLLAQGSVEQPVAKGKQKSSSNPVAEALRDRSLHRRKLENLLNGVGIERLYRRLSDKPH